MILDWDALRDIRGRCALVTGMFDPLHAGHVKYFDAAAALFDFELPLLCAVAPDAEVAAKHPPLVPEDQRVRVLDRLQPVTYTHLATKGLRAVIDQAEPAALIKGLDWEGKLGDLPVRAFYTDTNVESSGRLLRAYQHRLDAHAVERFERFVTTQADPVRPWEPVTDYSFEARKEIEGRHPALIWQHLIPCDDADVLDYGCGAGGHLVRLLLAYRQAHDPSSQVTVIGYDPQVRPPAPPWLVAQEPAGRVWDLVICREVLEHCSVRQIRQMVRTLVGLSSHYIYVTTRFAANPDHLLSVDESDGLDPTHCSMLTKEFMRTLFALEGCQSRPDLEARMDHMQKGRCLVFEVT